MATSASSSSPAASMVCYNPECKELKPERPRKGWRLRTGELAELCDRCALMYFYVTQVLLSRKEGFVRLSMEMLLAGGVVNLVESGFIVDVLFLVTSSHYWTLEELNALHTSNPAWHPSLFFHSPVPERLKDLSVKNWSQLAGSGPVPWRQAPSLFSSSIPSSEMNSRSPYEVDISSALNKLSTTERITVSSTEKKKIEDLSERLQNGCLKLGSREILENGTAGKNCEEQISSCLSMSSSLKEDQSTQQFGLTVPYSSTNDTNEQVGVSGTTLRPSPPSLSKQFIGNLHNGIDSSGDTHIRNARPRADARGKNQLLPRYWPRFTDQELQQISGDASDAGRIGRLVLPKKCAEAYFPPISQPEGLPLKVQDAKGKGWIFQFRFWPNNNSRMYVLEGVTPCIQSMQLQAGDIVTFSRLEPEGKLVMGFRKASAAPPSDQENETNKNGNGVSARGDAELADPSSWSKVDKSGYIAKEVLGAKALIPRKRKSSTLVSKSKRIRNENEDVMELKLTWEEAQGLLRPPNNHVPSIVVIEGIEFEEYEDAPVLGKPTIFATTNVGGKIQWVQCEDCSKFRKLPADALLPSKWTCSDNSWDPERSVCSAAQELTSEELEDLLPQSVSVAPKKMKAAKQDAEHVEALEGLDTLANLAILGEGDSLPASAQATTKHPRHRSGCSCIVCIQPPSGKGPKHKQTCTCNVCLTVKRRFRTLMLRREKKQSEKEAETTRKKQHQQQLPPQKLQVDTLISSNASDIPKQPKIVCEVLDDEPSKVKTSTSPFKGQIDLNIQPEREEELSPCSDSGDMMKLLQDATERYLRQQKLSSSGGCENPSGNHSRRDGGDAVGGKPNNGINLGSTQHDAADDGCPATLSVKASVSSTAAG
ncbi:B3 domain-containing protein [Morus notabilis]|uniref:B3 domain-containing protein n=1 Tax=Morus notabilis TaxID=981085 RepID=W9QZ54_9ROSA|nr:B3 domain-containing protein [Morus notabilis]